MQIHSLSDTHPMRLEIFLLSESNIKYAYRNYTF